MFRKNQTHFGQFANILRWCYLLDTVYDVSEMSEMDDILQILHQMINQQHGKNSFVLPFHSKMDLWKMKKKKKKTKKQRKKFWWDDKMIYEIFFAG